MGDGNTAETSRWFESFSLTELRRLLLVRAFIYNPELLLLNRPVEQYEASEAARILGLLREYVDQSGLEFSPEEVALQRPHTVFLCTGQDRERAEAAADIADLVWCFSEEGVTMKKNDRHFLLQEGKKTSKIVQSWQREVENKMNEVRLLKQ